MKIVFEWNCGNKLFHDILIIWTWSVFTWLRNYSQFSTKSSPWCLHLFELLQSESKCNNTICSNSSQSSTGYLSSASFFPLGWQHSCNLLLIGYSFFSWAQTKWKKKRNITLFKGQHSNFLCPKIVHNVMLNSQ